MIDGEGMNEEAIASDVSVTERWSQQRREDYAAGYEFARRELAPGLRGDLGLQGLRGALELAENFYDGTDYNFDRLAPDEQNEIVAAARFALTVLEQGEKLELCIGHLSPRDIQRENRCQLSMRGYYGECEFTPQFRFPASLLDQEATE